MNSSVLLEYSEYSLQTEINNNYQMAAFWPIGTGQIIRIVFLYSQKEVQILAFLHVICERIVSCPPPKNRLQRWRERAWSQARENHVDAILKKIASGNPSIIVCPCCLACHLLQPCLITFWQLLWGTLPIGYQVETPHTGHIGSTSPPPPLKGALPKSIIIQCIYISTLMAVVTENINLHSGV